MSKSYKKAIVKDDGIGHKLYRKTVRGTQKNYLRSNLDKFVEDEDAIIPDEKEIINDYDYSDYRFDCEHPRNGCKYPSDEDEEYLRKMRRK